jgi:hypothetical protein
MEGGYEIEKDFAMPVHISHLFFSPSFIPKQL